MFIVTSYPGQPLRLVQAPEHMRAHMESARWAIPFVRVASAQEVNAGKPLAEAAFEVESGRGSSPAQLRLLAALEASDLRRRQGRAKRIEWLAQHEVYASAIWVRAETAQLFAEARETFVDGHFAAALLLALAFLEHTLVEELQARNLLKKSPSFRDALVTAAAHQVFPKEWIDRADTLRTRRNPFAHLRPRGDENAMGARYRDLNMHPEDLLEQDATDAVDLMYKFYIKTLR